ncbi:helix-turn-helix transcriptional regulator [Paenibacillus validus]|uniref:HTH luxR-type domain-containing protein n=1 Tax=Paenibacillus validus TaxID=44253 RepID=A0A7X2ZEW5_9BACL|nr:hypothetical protein [Paenibacillus validus]MUG73626.1 hypothetical protein [Paenibacillus validus]
MASSKASMRIDNNGCLCRRARALVSARKKSGQAIYLPDSSLPHVAANTDKSFPLCWQQSKSNKIDLRGMNLKNYVKGLIEKAGVSLNPTLPKGTFNLTPREREIALSSMTCSSIAEMAEQLHVTEITVKKQDASSSDDRSS